MKKLLLFIFLAAALVFAGCGDSKEEEMRQLSSAIEGQTLTKDELQQAIRQYISSSEFQEQLFMMLSQFTGAQKIRAFTAVDSGAAGSMDSISSDALTTNDLAFVYDVSASAISFHKFNVTGSCASNTGVFLVYPTDCSGATSKGRWELLSNFRFGRSTTPESIYRDADNTDYDANVIVHVNCTATGSGAEVCDYEIRVQIGGTNLGSGSEGDYGQVFQWDGSDEALTLGDQATGEDISLDFETAVDNQVEVGTNSGTTEVYFGSIVVAGKMKSLSDSTATTYNVTTAQARGQTFFITTYAGTKTFVLPAAEAGMAVCVRNGQGVSQILRIDTDGTDYIVMSTGARTSAAGDYYGATADAGNQVCVVAIDATDWYVTGEVGTWTEE